MNRSTARRYAKALFELAQQEKLLDPVGERLARIEAMIREQPELRELCRNPIYQREERKRVLKTLLGKIGAQELLTRFFDLLIQKNRLSHLSEIVRLFNAFVDEAQGREQVRVRVARGLSPSRTETLRSRLGEILSRDVVLKVETDPALLGGVVIASGGRIYDGSLRSRLAELRRAVIKEPQ